MHSVRAPCLLLLFVLLLLDNTSQLLLLLLLLLLGSPLGAENECLLRYARYIICVTSERRRVAFVLFSHVARSRTGLAFLHWRSGKCGNI